MSDLEKKVHAVIDEKIKPHLNAHHGDIQVVSLIDGKLTVKLEGACKGCPGAQITFNDLIEQTFKEHVPEVKSIELKQELSEDMIAFAKKMLKR